MTGKQKIIVGAIAVSVFIVGIVVFVVLYTQLFDDDVTQIQAVMAHGLAFDYAPLEPTGAYSPEDTFYLSVRLDNAPSDSVVTAVWQYEGSRILAQDQIVGDVNDSHIVGFEMARTDDTWPVGDYTVDIMVNGEPVGQVSFVVR